MKAAIYARVSKDDGSQTVENQLLELRRFAQSQGWTLSQEYIDQASGAKSDREQFIAMFEDASKRRFDVVVFWSLDRLTREGALQTLQYLNRLSQYGVGFRSFTEPYLDSCGMFKDAVIAILGTIARQERQRLIERTKAGLARARARGKAIGRPKVVVDAVKLAAMRAQGLSWGQIEKATGLSTGTIRRAVASLAKKVVESAAVSPTESVAEFAA